MATDLHHLVSLVLLALRTPTPDSSNCWCRRWPGPDPATHTDACLDAGFALDLLRAKIRGT